MRFPCCVTTGLRQRGTAVYNPHMHCCQEIWKNCYALHSYANTSLLLSSTPLRLLRPHWMAITWDQHCEKIKYWFKLSINMPRRKFFAGFTHAYDVVTISHVVNHVQQQQKLWNARWYTTVMLTIVRSLKITQNRRQLRFKDLFCPTLDTQSKKMS